MPTCPFSHGVPAGDDPFRAARESSGVLPAEFQNRPVPMILTHAGVKEAARDWKTFSSILLLAAGRTAVWAPSMPGCSFVLFYGS